MNLLERVGALFKPKPRENTDRQVLVAVLTQARRAYDGEDYDRALDLYAEAQHLLADHPNDLSRLDTLLQLADVYMALKRFDDAARTIDEAHVVAEAQPRRSAAAFVLLARGLLADAQNDARSAEETWEHSREMARSIGAPSPQGRATAFLADVALREGNASYAVHLLREAIPLMQSARDTQILVFAFGRLGSALIASGQEAQGRQVINTALQHGMELHQIAALRTLCLDAAQQTMAVQEYTLAAQYLTNALKLFPYPARTPHIWLQTHLDATYCALKTSQLDTAAHLLDTAQGLVLTITSPDAPTHIQALRGLLAYAQRHDEQAVAELQAALRSVPSLPTRLHEDSWLTLCLALARLRRTDVTLSAFEQALTALPDPDNQMTLFRTRADFLSGLPLRRRDALDDYQKALRLADTHDTRWQPVLHAHLGRVAGELGEGTRAKRSLEQALLLVNTISDPLIRHLTYETAADGGIEYSDPDTVDSLYSSAQTLAQETKDTLSAARVRGKRGLLLTRIGRSAEAVVELTAARADLKTYDALWSAMVTGALGTAYCALGETNTALAHHYEALSSLDTTAYPEQVALLHLLLADTLSAAQQAHPQTQTHYDTALELANSSDNRLLVYRVTLAAVADALKEQNTARATDLLNSVERDLRRSGASRLHAELVTLQSRVAAQSGDAEAAARYWNEAMSLRRTAQLPDLQPEWLS